MIEQMPKTWAIWNLLPLMYVSFLFELLRHLFDPVLMIAYMEPLRDRTMEPLGDRGYGATL